MGGTALVGEVTPPGGFARPWLSDGIDEAPLGIPVEGVPIDGKLKPPVALSPDGVKGAPMELAGGLGRGTEAPAPGLNWPASVNGESELPISETCP